jgi:hypothetical protein
MTSASSTQTLWTVGTPSRVRPDVVRVFERDPDLLAGVDAATADVLRRRVVAPRLQLTRGPWAPRPDDARFAGALGLLVLDGLVIRTICVQGRDCAELVGAGDLLRPWETAQDGLVEGPCSWRVLEPTTVAILDRQFAAVVARCPSVIVTLFARSAQRTRGLALHLALAHIRQAETRLLTLFWHLAGRWGRMTPRGVELPLPLTHELLGQLVCLHRPTTSTALQRLAAAGEIARTPNRGWLLLGDPPAGELPAQASRAA